MVNEEIARIFERMARILDFKQADRFRTVAYERAAVSVRDAEDLAVVDRNIALEVSGAWQRLDLNDVMARTAQQAGALLAIGSDAHSAGQMDHVRYGVTQARRGWVASESVINTWPLAKLKKWLQR